MKAVLLNRVLLVLSFVGLFVASALSMEHAMNIILPCGAAKGCEAVANHPSSMLFGVIPVAYIGFGGYLLMAGLAIARALKSPYDPMLVTVGYVAAAAGTAFSLYLQYISFFTIHAICPYCLTSAITMILTLITYALLANEVNGKVSKPATEATKLDMWMIGGFPFAIVLGLTMMGGKDKAKPVLENSKIELTLQNLVPDHPNAFGPDSAPITIIEFADMCCHTCQIMTPKLKDFEKQHPAAVRIVYRHFPLPMHKYGKVTAAMGQYAADKGRFWDFTSSVMGLQREPESVAELLGIAKSVGLDSDDMKKHLVDTKDPIYDTVTADLNLGHKIGVNSTPTFIILGKGMKADPCGPGEILDKLNGPLYKSLLAGNG